MVGGWGGRGRQRGTGQGGGGEDELEVDVGAVEAVGLVDLGDVLGVGEGDVDAVVEGAAVDGGLDDLDGGVVADVDARVDGQRHLRQAEGARVGFGGGADDLEGRHHRVRHVERHGAVAHVDVEEGGRVSGEPAWLDGDGAAFDGPERAVCRGGHAAA